MRRHATTIVLLVVALALGAWLWLDRDKVTQGERERRENNVFVAWRKDELSRVEIAHEGETIVLVRDARADSAWRMTSPSEERVDQAAAERLVTTLEFATRVRKVSGDSDLGLESPRARGSVTMGSLVMRFDLGAPSPRPEGTSYFRVDGGEPFVASKELTQALLASADTLRDRSVVPYLSLELARFEVKHDGAGFAVERADERSFRVSGANLLASRAALDKVWGALAEMRAEAFPKSADAARLTSSPKATILMTPKESGKPLGELVIGEECPDHPNDVVVLRKQPTRVAACAPKGALSALLSMTPDSLLDRRPLSFRHDEIEELRLERMGKEPLVVEVARRGSGFHQREPEDRELDKAEAEAVSDLLVRIEHSEATSVRLGGEAFEPIAKAKVRSGEHEEVVEVGPLGGETVTLRRLRDDARLAVTPAIARRLVARKTLTRPLSIIGPDKPARSVKRVILRCGVAQELADDGAGLRLTEPKGYETDGQITQLVDAITRGKAIAWVSDRDDGSFGLSEDGCRVRLVEDGGDVLTLLLGPEAEGGAYARLVEPGPEVFVAPRSLLDLAKRIYVSRAALRVDPSRVESVRVTIGGAPRDLESVGSGGSLRDRVGALYADRVVSIGDARVSPVEMEITIATKLESDAGPVRPGPTKHIACGRVEEGWRRCQTPDVKAIFAVHESTLQSLFPIVDAGRDGDASH